MQLFYFFYDLLDDEKEIENGTYTLADYGEEDKILPKLQEKVSGIIMEKQTHPESVKIKFLTYFFYDSNPKAMNLYDTFALADDLFKKFKEQNPQYKYEE